MGKFEITTRSNGEYQFNLVAENGQVILTSQGYTSKDGCLNGIASVQKNSQDENMFERKEASNGALYFNLKASNGQVIGTSQMYKDANGRDKGMRSVANNAPEATIVAL